MTGIFEVREATSDDCLGVRRVLDAAMLDVRDDLGERVEAGDVLVASEAQHASERRVSRDAPRPSDHASGDSREQTVEPRDTATEARDGASEDDEDATILGALVLLPRESGGYVDAVAVRRARRAQGVGTALVRTAAERHARLTAEFDANVRPFYESLGFEISRVEGDAGRLRGCYDGNEG